MADRFDASSLAAPDSSPPPPSSCLWRDHNFSRPRAATAPITANITSSTSTTLHQWLPVGSMFEGESGGGGGLIAMLQRALCNVHQRGGQYRTVLTRESPDSGLELDQLESGASRAAIKADASGREDLGHRTAEEAAEDELKRTKPRLSLGRLLSSFNSGRPSESLSMFDFPSPSPLADPNGYAQSPIAQLSRSNGVLMHENQQLANRVQELEHSLRDHVAHLNSVYFTLHQRHGFDALQLPDGELVQLSQFKGPEVVLLSFVCSPSSSSTANGAQQQLATRRTRRHRLQQQQIRQKQPTANNGLVESSPSISGASSCSVVSGSADSSLDPVEMFHQLCIRPKAAEMADDDREQIQAYVDWLKGGGGGEGQHEGDKHRMLAKLRAQQVQAQVQLQANGGPSTTANGSAGRVHFSVDGRQQPQGEVPTTTAAAEGGGQQKRNLLLLNGWRNVRSETAGEQPALEVLRRGSTVDGQQLVKLSTPSPNAGGGRSPSSPRAAFGGAKSQRIRSQVPSASYLGTRRMTSGSISPGMAAASSCSSAALMSSNHRASASAASGEERTPRRGGGIGLVSACRNTMRANLEQRVVKRNLI